jgi:iron-sulfur cluster repair protein YtfE (RIC family)
MNRRNIMEPSEVRRRVLRDHQSLCQRVEQVESLAEEVIGGGQAPDGLCEATGELLRALTDHMSWEDRHLVPALRDADAWGPERVARFEAEHLQQRTQLAELLEGLEDRSQPPQALAHRVLEWLSDLHADMDEEESAFLDRDLLRDDVIGIDVESG